MFFVLLTMMCIIINFIVYDYILQKYACDFGLYLVIKR